MRVKSRTVLKPIGSTIAYDDYITIMESHGNILEDNKSELNAVPHILYKQTNRVAVNLSCPTTDGFRWIFVIVSRSFREISSWPRVLNWEYFIRDQLFCSGYFSLVRHGAFAQYIDQLG